MTLIKIAWRNIVRSRRRSLITIGAVGFGLGALIFIWGFVAGAHRQMIENYTSLTTSQVQIQQKGFQQTQKLETYLDNPDQLLARLELSSSLAAVAPRIRAVGLISSSESSAGTLILGVDPVKEARLSRLAQQVKQGAFLQLGEDKQVIIGQALAKNLNVGLGEKIVMMSQALDGSIASGAYRIVGLLNTGIDEIDKGLVLMTYAAAEQLFVMENKASEIALKLVDVDQTPQVVQSLKDLFPQDNIEVLSWDQISPMLKQWIEFDDAFVWVIVLIIMIVVAIGILNTVLMGVLERTREFGILMAIGTARGQVILMVVLESFFLGVIGSLFGLLLGVVLISHFGYHGINLSIFNNAFSSFYMDPVIYPQFAGGYVWASTGMVLTVSCLASIYPSWYAAHLKPVEAIRTI